jgi:ADP-heptose:LPS heptosyltransferase
MAALRAAYPEARITLGCRAAVASLVQLYAEPPDEVLPLEIDPYSHGEPTPDLVSRTRELLETLSSANPDLYIGAGLRPPWLSWIIAAKLQPARAVIASDARPAWLAQEMMTALSLTEATFEYVAVPAGIHERDRYAALLEHAGVPWKEGVRVRIPDAVARDATQILDAAGFSDGNYLACFPVSSPVTPEKCWPLERYTQVLCEVHAEYGLPVLLLGDLQEGAEIEQYAGVLRSMGMRVASFVGSPHEIPTAGALLSNARAYLGNDTGLAHLAAAVDTPGLTVYGGGTWPMYAPWKPGSVGVVHELACFGCYWDCTFGRGVCVESVPAGNVFSALSGLLQNDGAEKPEIVDLDLIPAEEQAVIAGATKRYRALQLDRAARLEALELGRRELMESRAKQKELQAAADDRLEALRETKDALGRAIHESHRLQELETSAEVARAQAAEHDRVVAELDAALADRDRLVRQLQDAGEQLTAALTEREERIKALTARADEHRLVLQGAEERERVISEMQAALEETDRRAKALQEAADVRGQTIEELSTALEKQNVRVQALEEGAKNFQEMHATAQEREKIIFELNAALNEREKNAQKVLDVATEREALILELSAAVEERERRIAQMQQIAEERLVALKETDEGLRAITAEADRRAIMLAEVTSLLREKTDES